MITANTVITVMNTADAINNNCISDNIDVANNSYIVRLKTN